MYRAGNTEFENLLLGVSGPFQERNLLTALHALWVLDQNTEFKVSDTQMRKGLRDIRKLTGYKGRWQVLGKSPIVLTDSAHNVDGLALVLRKISERQGAKHFVLGFSNDKELEPILDLFPKDAAYYFVRPDVPRGLDASVLAEQASGNGLIGKSYRSVKQGVAAAKRKAGARDLVYIGGSSFVVAEVV